MYFLENLKNLFKFNVYVQRPEMQHVYVSSFTKETSWNINIIDELKISDELKKDIKEKCLGFSAAQIISLYEKLWRMEEKDINKVFEQIGWPLRPYEVDNFLRQLYVYLSPDEYIQNDIIWNDWINSSVLSPEQKKFYEWIKSLRENLSNNQKESKYFTKMKDYLNKALNDELKKEVKKDIQDWDPTVHLFVSFIDKIYKKVEELSKKQENISKEIINKLYELREGMQKSEDKVEYEKWVEWEENDDFDKKKLKTISNNEFLKLNPEKRLQHITKNHVDSESVASWKVNDLEFTFTFDGKYNKELYLRTTAWQVLPKEVWVVEKNWIIYERKGLKWEFFTSWNKRLIIREATQINIEKVRTEDEIKKIEESNNSKIDIFEKSKDYKEGFDDIIAEAVKRWIDPKFAVLAFSEKVSKTKNIFERSVLIEEMFTEYDRQRWKLDDVYKNKNDAFKITLLKLFSNNYKEKAKQAWIKEEVIKDYEYNKETYETKEDFYKLVISKSKEVEKNYWVPWKVTLWQAILESWHWKSELSKKYNNFFWHTARPWQKSVQMRDNWNLRNFAVYDSVLEWLEAHGKFLSSPRYKKAFNFKNNPVKFIEEIKRAWYAEDPNYVKKVVSTIRARWITI